MLGYIGYTLSDSIYNIRVVVFCLLIDPLLSIIVISPMISRLFLINLLFASDVNNR